MHSTQDPSVGSNIEEWGLATETSRWRKRQEEGCRWILWAPAGNRQAKSAKSRRRMSMSPDKSSSRKQEESCWDCSTQGGHLMSNKTRKLSGESFKWLKRAYQGIHIPAPKKQPIVEGRLSTLVRKAIRTSITI